MANDLELLAAANPVSKDEAIDWTRSPAAADVWHDILDATESQLHVGRIDRPGGPRRISLLVAAALVIMAAFPLVWWQTTDGAPFRSGLSNQLGIGHVWPEHPVDLTPAELGRAFAIDVLGWSEADISTDSRFTEPGDTVVTISALDDRFVALLVRAAAGGNVITRVGAPDLYGPHLVFSSQGGAYGWGLAPGGLLVGERSASIPESAVRAESVGVFVRSLDGEVAGPVEVILMHDGTRVLVEDLGDAERIASALVLYRNGDGSVIGAGGGTFAEGEPLAASPTPSEIRADGLVTQPELWSAVESVVRCIAGQGIRTDAQVGLDGSYSFSVESGDNTDGPFVACNSVHIGSVETAWADQNAPFFESEAAFYNGVLDCVEAETGMAFPDVEDPAPERPTSAAIAAAPHVYDACFDDVVAVHPARLLGTG